MSTRRRAPVFFSRPAAAFLGLAALLILGSCGGGSSAPPPPPPPPSLTFLGATQASVAGGSTLPARNGLAKPTDTFDIATQTAPQGSGTSAPAQSVTLFYSTNRFATQSSAPLSFVSNGNGPARDRALWKVNIGPFPSGTEIQYFVRATSGGTTITDNNSASNYQFNVPWVGSIPLSPPFVVLQWFATSWRDIQRRLPEIVNSGYSTIYLPPPQKAASGNTSVGFDPFDRFDLGDRFQRGSVATQYGTTQELLELVDAAHQLGLRVCFDTLANHNANRTSGVNPDGYPDVIPEDFHFQGSNGQTISDFSTFGFQTFNYELLGLVDFAQEDGNVVTKPAAPANSQIALNAAQKPAWVRHPQVPQYYPGGISVSEDIRQFFARWGLWLGETVGCDCFRLDAARHMPPPFFGGSSTFTGAGNQTYTVTAPGFLPVLQQGVTNRGAGPALIFGEIFNSDPLEYATYARTGMDLLDFTLTFNSPKIFNANGAGDIGAVLGNSPSGDAGIGFQFGGMDPSVALGQIHNHDVDLPVSENLAYAFLLTRTGQPVVYFDGNNLPKPLPPNPNAFPKPGRTDALGEGTSYTVQLVDAHLRYTRGDMVNRFTSPDVYVYERQVNGQGVLLVGLNDNGTSTGAQSVTVPTAFPAGATLVDLSGQQPPVTVAANQQVTITVPSNFDAVNSNNGRGYVLYAMQAPQGVGMFPVTIEQNGSAVVPQPMPTADGKVRDPQPGTTVMVPVVTSNSVNFKLATDSTAANAVVKLDGGGMALAGIASLAGTPEGLSDGFVPASGSGGSYSLLNVDLSGLREGLHVVEFRVFLSQPAGRVPVFNIFRQVFVLDRPDTGPHTIDGLLSDFGAGALKAQQTVATSDPGRNALNQLLVEQDSQNLYVGLVANADSTESAANLNGVVIWIDIDSGAGTGLTNLGALHDDSGPAARLISNTSVTAPVGFGAEFVAASFRGGELSTMQTVVTSTGQRRIGAPKMTPPFGASAGFYKIDATKPNQLQPLPAQIAWDPPTVARNGNAAAESATTGGSGNGLEVAIRLSDLYPAGMPPGAKIGVYAYITTTGETGAILAASDPLRVTLGGRPRAVGHQSNQILSYVP